MASKFCYINNPLYDTKKCDEKQRAFPVGFFAIMNFYLSLKLLSFLPGRYSGSLFLMFHILSHCELIVSSRYNISIFSLHHTVDSDAEPRFNLLAP